MFYISINLSSFIATNGFNTQIWLLTSGKGNNKTSSLCDELQISDLNWIKGH